jgi:hypothetical protein
MLNKYIISCIKNQGAGNQLPGIKTFMEKR